MTTLEKLESLKNRTVGIAGCGGLGSNCAAALARTGVTNLILVDFDTVSRGNLNRQYFFLDQLGKKKVEALRENLLRINLELNIECHDVMLDSVSILRLFAGCDVIVEAFDLAEAKEMIVETVLGKMPEKYLVSGLGLAGWGGNNKIQESRYGKLIVCGDQEQEVSEDFPPLAPRVGVVANMQANAVLEILLDVLPLNL
ncbi:MAG: sulfur carrier protein ThiS adenylyltransferase ThiF [Bacteroidota bacterium]